MNTSQYKTVVFTRRLRSGLLLALAFLFASIALFADETTLYSVPANDSTVSDAKVSLAGVAGHSKAVPGDAIPQPLPLEAAKGFRFEDAGTNTIALFEGDEPVYHYVYDLITNENVPENAGRRRTRGCYLHPLFGINGEVLTDDFPRDHYHHHGLFWAWPHVQVGGEHHDFWNQTTDLQQRFVKWLVKEAGDDAAVLAVENGWFIGERKIMTERVWLRSYRKVAGRSQAAPFPHDGSRSLDVQLFFVPEEPITLRGAEGKSYGGLCIRFKPELAPPGNVMENTIAKITVPAGVTTADLPEERLMWADFASKFDGRDTVSGAAIFVPPTHPDYPPTWLTRHYGAMCVGWPGVHDRTFGSGIPFSLEYRVWVHETDLDLQQLTDAYEAYTKEKR